MILSQNEGACVLRLEGDVNIASAAELKKLLVEGLTCDGELRVDLESVSDFDVTAWQLLWAAEREALVSGKRLCLAGQLPEHIAVAVSGGGFDRFPVPADLKADPTEDSKADPK
jgi:anti-anti-sigma regulatory factor